MWLRASSMQLVSACTLVRAPNLAARAGADYCIAAMCHALRLSATVGGGCTAHVTIIRSRRASETLVSHMGSAPTRCLFAYVLRRSWHASVPHSLRRVDVPLYISRPPPSSSHF